VAGHAEESQGNFARFIRWAGQLLRGESLGQEAGAVERRELVIAADRLVVDRHERHLVVGEASGVEQRLRTNAVAAPLRRVEANPGHGSINACKLRSIP